MLTNLSNMCGRFIISKKVEEINERFHVDVEKEQYKIIYNAAPGQNLPVITNRKPGKLSFFKWGLVPYWAKDVKIGYKMINSRAETLLEKPSFKNAVQKRRCLVIANGFYEWKKTGNARQPYLICLKDNSLFAFAGLCVYWNKDGIELSSFSSVTTAPNSLTKPIHNRMPVILSREHANYWLDESFNPVDLGEICQPYPPDFMQAFPVSTRVNSVANNDASLLEEIQV